MRHRRANEVPGLIRRQKVYQRGYAEAAGGDLVLFHIVEGDCECMLLLLDPQQRHCNMQR